MECPHHFHRLLRLHGASRLGQMFVITLGPGNIDLSLPATIGFASAVAMKVMDGSDARIGLGLAAALGAGLLIGTAITC